MGKSLPRFKQTNFVARSEMWREKFTTVIISWFCRYFRKRWEFYSCSTHEYAMQCMQYACTKAVRERKVYKRFPSKVLWLRDVLKTLQYINSTSIYIHRYHCPLDPWKLILSHVKNCCVAIISWTMNIHTVHVHCTMYIIQCTA